MYSTENEDGMRFNTKDLYIKKDICSISNYSISNKEIIMDTMSVYFCADEIQRLKFKLRYIKEENKKTDGIEIRNSKLNYECERNKKN